MAKEKTGKLHLCLDCGGSKTSLIIGTKGSGEILTRTLGGPSNFSYLGVKDFTSVIKETVGRSLQDEAVKSHIGGSAALTLPLTEEESPFHSAWIAVSGIDTAGDAATAQEAMSALLGIPKGNRLQVTNDSYLLAAPLATQTKYRTCIAVIAGTGSCIVSFRKSADNSTLVGLARMGGYGWILGDEGSGFQVGRETVRQLVMADDLAMLNNENLTIGDDLASASASASSVTNGTGPEPQPTYDLKSLVLDHFGLPTASHASNIFTQVYAPDPNPTLAASQVKDNATTVNGHLLLERQQRLSRLPPVVFKAAFQPSDGSMNSKDKQKGFVPHPIAVKALRYCVESLADFIIALCAPPSAKLSPHSKHVIAAESLLCVGGSLMKQPPYRALLGSVLKEKGHAFAEVVYVEDCEKRGIEALVAQSLVEDRLR